MTDKELLIAIRTTLDTKFEVKSNGLWDLLLNHVDTLDTLEVLLTKNGYPAVKVDETNAA